MANAADVSKAVVSAPKPTGLQEILKKSAKELGRALPAHMNPERLTRIALTCIRLNPRLAECTQESFMGSLFTGAQLGLEPVGGRAYLIPFKRSKKKADGSWHSVLECQFVIGYKGLADLFYRHEKAVELAWGIIHEKDEYAYEFGTNAFLKHKPALSGRGTPVAYYVMATLKSGGKPFMVMSAADCMEHGKKHSKTFDAKTGMFDKSSPWATAPDSMCLKTVLIQLMKLLPLSVELQKAIQADETSRDFREGIDDALDLPTTTDWTPDAAIDAAVVDDDDAGSAQEPSGPILGAKS